MKFVCCWLYAIDRYGFPPSIPDTLTALREIKQLGFDYAELEGVSGPNIEAVYEHRFEIKKLGDGDRLEDCQLRSRDSRTKGTG